MRYEYWVTTVPFYQGMTQMMTLPGPGYRLRESKVVEISRSIPVPSTTYPVTSGSAAYGFAPSPVIEQPSHTLVMVWEKFFEDQTV